MLFANFAEAMAEGRGKAQADTLRKTRVGDGGPRAPGRRLHGRRSRRHPRPLQLGDLCVVAAGEVIPGDGDVVEGIATVDESAITGESAPVIRESGGDRSAVTGGTRVLSDEIVVRITARPGETFLDRMIALVEGADRQKTPNEIALSILLAGLTIIFLLAVVTLQPFAIYSGAEQSIIVLVALLVCLIPTTIGGAAVGHRHRRHGPARAAQRAGHVGAGGRGRRRRHHPAARQDRHHHLRHPAGRRVPPRARRDRAGAGRGRAGVEPGRRDPGGSLDRRAGRQRFGLTESVEPGAVMVPFTAQTRMSGMDFPDGPLRSARAPPTRCAGWSTTRAATVPLEVLPIVEQVSRDGATPLVVVDGAAQSCGVIHLKDTVKPGMRERFDELRAMGIRTVMITGDNPLTAAAIAKEAGVDDFLAEATPEDKMALIREEQAGGNLVAMTGDGTNDAPALAQADVGVAMNTGTQAAKEAGNMVDLDSNPTKLIEIVEIGKQLLITRGSLTTFSIANDVAKYFAIIPAMFAGVLPGPRAAQRHGARPRPARRSSRRSSSTPSSSWRSSRSPCEACKFRAEGAARGAAPQPPHLRRRRPHRPVRRHQADRHRHHRAGSEVT